MAQINARVADEDKEKADQVLKSHGLSVSGYFASIIEYIADTGAIPFEIRQKPKLVNLDEVYSEVVEKFSDLYNDLVSLKKSMEPGIGDQMTRCEPVSRDYSYAVSFLRENERYVYGAPCQLEKAVIGDGSLRSFSLSRERFALLEGLLAEALRCANFNSRQLESDDLKQMADAISDVKVPLQFLRDLMPAQRSVESRIAFFLIAAKDAVHAARGLTEGPYDQIMFPHWRSRFDAGCRQVQACRKRVGESAWDNEIQELVKQVCQIKKEIDLWNYRRLEYASKNDLKWLNFPGDAIAVAEKKIFMLQQGAMRTGWRFT